MLEEVLAWGLGARFRDRRQRVQRRGQPEAGEKTPAGLAVRHRKQPHRAGNRSLRCPTSCIHAIVRGQRPLDTSAKARHPDDGLLVWLKGFGNVKLFRAWLKDQPRHYAVYLPDDDGLAAVSRKTFTGQHDRHWHIEQHHRAIKQACNIEKFQVRSKTAIRTTCSPPCAAMSSSRNPAPCP